MAGTLGPPWLADGMTSPTIAVGLREALSEWPGMAGVEPDRMHVLTAGVLRVADVTQWVGVPEPDPAMVWVKLCAPDPRPGEEPQWLEFRPGEWRPRFDEGFCCWTSDLVAARIG